MDRRLRHGTDCLTVAIPVVGFAFPDIFVGLPGLILVGQSGMGTLTHT